MLLDNHDPSLSDGFVICTEPELAIIAIHCQAELLFALLQSNKALIQVEVECSTALTLAIFHFEVLEDAIFHLNYTALPPLKNRWAVLLETTFFRWR